MYVPVADRGVEVPPKRLEIRGINMDKNISVCCKVMFKNVKCGKISTKLERGRDTEGAKFANFFNDLYFVKLWHKYCFYTT